MLLSCCNHSFRVTTRRPIDRTLVFLQIFCYQSIHQYAARQQLFNNDSQYRPATSTVHKEKHFVQRYKDSFASRLPSNPTFFANPKENKRMIGKTVDTNGFIGKRKDLSDKLSFVQLIIPGSRNESGIQVVSRVTDGQTDGQITHQKLRDIKTHSAVSVSATLELKHQPKGKSGVAEPFEKFSSENLELVLQDIKCLASFPADIIVNEEAQFGPENRHLQIRFNPALRKRLRFRDRVLRECRVVLDDFQEIETPILFKSTPEGAREFLIPTRRPGHAYALPQSPQQYKQILMASGIHRYFQIAKCFRDEDLRADRQPEFTQIDLEMAFADGKAVMERVEIFICKLFQKLEGHGLVIPPPNLPFIRIPYQKAMLNFGTDKPDLRIPGTIRSVNRLMTSDFIDKVTSLPDPVVEAWKITLNADPSGVRRFVRQFMDSPEAIPFQENSDGAPGVFVYDPRKPIQGLQSFGYEGAELLKKLYGNSPVTKNDEAEHSKSLIESLGANEEPLQEGDLMFIQARPRGRLSGGSTALGRLRTAIHKAVISKGLLNQDRSDRFLWITDFPLFTRHDNMDSSQGGSSGFSSTHHPFTAPKTVLDVDLMMTDPLEATADHYDLVLNGMELGGGSRRIHDSKMQQYVMREILKMSEERIGDFSHLFEVLRAGCPPHAGIALGLDRLVAIMQGVDSIRDVIAFPKSGRGEDPLVKSPTPITRDQQDTYCIKVIE